MTNSSGVVTRSNLWPWTMVVGLLAGFIVGRESGPRRPATDRHETTAAAAPAVAPAPAPAPVPAVRPPPAVPRPAGPPAFALPAHSPRKGPRHAKVSIVAFSDFQ